MDLPNLVKRIIMGLIMMSSWIFFIYHGCVPVAFFTSLLQVGMFREYLEIALAHLGESGRKGSPAPRLTYFQRRVLPWYFFGVTLVGITLESFAGPMKGSFPWTGVFLDQYHGFVFKFAFLIGVMAFVCSIGVGSGSVDPAGLKRHYLLVAYTLTGLVGVVVPLSAGLKPMMDSAIYFVLASTLVVMNDIFAFFIGKFFGRRGLTPLSPKKTIEGFVGSLVLTVVFGYYFALQLAEWERMYCLREFLWTAPSCSDRPYSFLMREYHLPLLPTFRARPLVFHSLSLSLLSSLVAPFGGMLASGYKRIHGVKDFGGLIPGHGGIFDRFDCEPIMFACLSAYHAAFIGPFDRGL